MHLKKGNLWLCNLSLIKCPKMTYRLVFPLEFITFSDAICLLSHDSQDAQEYLILGQSYLKWILKCFGKFCNSQIESQRQLALHHCPQSSSYWEALQKLKQFEQLCVDGLIGWHFRNQNPFWFRCTFLSPPVHAQSWNQNEEKIKKFPCEIKILLTIFHQHPRDHCNIIALG